VLAPPSTPPTPLSTSRARPHRRPHAGEAPPCSSPHRLLALVTSPPRCTRATPPRCAHARAGPSWARPWAAHTAQAEAEPGQAGPCTLHRPSAPTLCYWAAGGFGPVAFDLDFYIFQIYSNPYKFKNFCRIHLNSENYETNFVE
jgi:hypothetical protein